MTEGEVPARSGTARALAGGGGELGELIAAAAWEGTELGPPESWPQALVTSIGLCLRSPFPMIVCWGPEHRYFYNDAYLPIIAGKHPWALGRTVREIWPEAWEGLAPHLEGALAGRASLAEDGLWLLHRRGFLEECYVTLAFSPIPDADGVGGVLVVLHETTGTILGNRRLAVLRDLPEACAGLLDPADVCAAAAGVLAGNPRDLPAAALYLLDEDGTARRAGLAGDPPDGLLPGTVAAAAGAWELGAPQERLVEGLRERFGLDGDAPDRAVVVPVRAGGGAVRGALVALVSPLRPLDDDYRSFLGLVAGAVATALDQAHAVSAERARAAALADLDRARTVFFSDVSHEFRTPLTLLLGPLQDALDDTAQALGPRQAERVELARRNALRLQRLVDTLLKFSRAEADRTELRPEPTDLPAFTADLAAVFRSAVERAGIELRVHAPPLPRPVEVDRPQWERVVLNLLSNALKFTFTGTIGVSVADEDGAAVLRVRDTGVGIAPEDLPHVFERFYRVRSARSRSHEGSGIGLALVHQLVTAHGGTIIADSTPGVGTVVTVRLPYVAARGRAPQPAGLRLPAPATPGPAALPFLAEAESATAEPAASGAPAANGGPVRTLLLAEDNPDMAAYLTRLLADTWSVHRVRDGAEALDAARALRPDLVLADVMMPRVDGLELVRRLRADPDTAHLVVVLLTARAGSESAVEGLAAGADDYLVKPFTAADLRARLDSRHRLRRTPPPAPGSAEADPPGRGSAAADPPGRHDPADERGLRRELDVPRTPGALRGLRRTVEEFVADAGGTDDDVDAVVLAATEAAANFVEHVVPGPGDGPAELADRLRVTLLARDGAGPGRVDLTVAITAAGPFLARTPPRHRGRGGQVMASGTGVALGHADGLLTLTLTRTLGGHPPGAAPPG